MNIAQTFLIELAHEAPNFRETFARIPDGQTAFKPHEKSMRLLSVAVHITEMLLWIPKALQTAELDFAKTPYAPPRIQQKAELLAFWDASFAETKAALTGASDETLNENWLIRHGEKIFIKAPKAKIIRADVLNHIYHHRGQISVYLRLLNVPVPGPYGPSADEK